MADEIVLYLGSLKELNSRYLDKQYKLADQLSYRSPFPGWASNIEEITKRDLREKGFDGLVKKTFVPAFLGGPNKTDISHFIEGIPIKRQRLSPLSTT